MKVQNPIIGRARGSAGGMTFCKNYDKNVARAKAFEVSNPKTQAQQTQRDFFKQLTALCADFSEDQLRTLFPSKPKTMSRRNALAKQIAESYTIDGTTKNIAFERIFTLGNAPVMNIERAQFTFEDDHLVADWSESVPAQGEFKGNFVVLVVINGDKEQIVLTITQEVFSDGQSTIPIPIGWDLGDEVFGFPLITNVRGDSGVNPTFGKMTIVRRPANKND